MTYIEQVQLALGDVAAGEIIPFPLFPIGNWKSAKYPNLPLTRELAETLIANHEAGILGTEPMVDSSGKHDTSSPAAAWFKRLYIAPTDDGEMLMADGKLTDLGAELLTSEQYRYISVEIDKVTDNRSGKVTPNVLKSATLTNTPVLRIMPAILDAGDRIAASEGISVALSEIVDVDDDDAAQEADPVAELLADLEALASKLDERLKGKKGMPSARAFLREVRAKVGAYRTSEDIHEPNGSHTLSDSDPATTPDDAIPAASSHDAKGMEGTAVELAEATAAPKGVDDMKSIIDALKLSESADEATVLAAVQGLIDGKAASDLKLAEVEKAAHTAAVEVTLGELITGGHLAPGQKDAWLKLAEDSPDSFAAMAEAAKSQKVIDLSEHGADAEHAAKEYEDPSVELAERAAAKVAAGIVSDIVSAQDMVLAEDPALRDRLFNISTITEER